MSARRWLSYLAFAVAGAGLACSNSTAPVGPAHKRVNVASPVQGVFSRYILISGVMVCVEDCDDDHNAKVQGLPSVLDTLPSETSP
jgi:hypothetical protein